MTVDGLEEKPAQEVRRVLRARRVRFRTVRGHRDEADALLRLADAVVGFLRDHRKGALYARDLWPRLRPHLQRLTPSLIRRSRRNREESQQGPAPADPCTSPGCP